MRKFPQRFGWRGVGFEKPYDLQVMSLDELPGLLQFSRAGVQLRYVNGLFNCHRKKKIYVILEGFA